MGEIPRCEFPALPRNGAAGTLTCTATTTRGVARRAEAVYVLHAFQKKSRATPKKDIDTTKRRFAQLSRGVK
jgi:hypothetical protein